MLDVPPSLPHVRPSAVVAAAATPTANADRRILPVKSIVSDREEKTKLDVMHGVMHHISLKRCECLLC